MTTTQDQDIEFPDVHQGVLDDATLEQYFYDLEHATRVFGVLVKGAPERYANERNMKLSTAREIFEKGLVRGMQVRYVWNGGEWWDTLMRTPQGVRLVRIQQDWLDDDDS